MQASGSASRWFLSKCCSNPPSLVMAQDRIQASPQLLIYSCSEANRGKGARPQSSERARMRQAETWAEA